jgi:hypothetical protein
MRTVQTRRLNGDFGLSDRMSVQEAVLCGRDRVHQSFGCSRTALQAVRECASEMVKKSSCSVLPYGGTRTFKKALKCSRKVIQASFCRDDGIFSLVRGSIWLPVVYTPSNLFPCTDKAYLCSVVLRPGQRDQAADASFNSALAVSLGIGELGSSVLFARHTPHALCDRLRSARHTPHVPISNQGTVTNHHKNVNQDGAGWLMSRQVTHVGCKAIQISPCSVGFCGLLVCGRRVIQRVHTSNTHPLMYCVCEFLCGDNSMVCSWSGFWSVWRVFYSLLACLWLCARWKIETRRLNAHFGGVVMSDQKILQHLVMLSVLVVVFK